MYQLMDWIFPYFFILDIVAESILAFVEIVTHLSFERLLSVKRPLLVP